MTHPDDERLTRAENFWLFVWLFLIMAGIVWTIVTVLL